MSTAKQSLYGPSRSVQIFVNYNNNFSVASSEKVILNIEIENNFSVASSKKVILNKIIYGSGGRTVCPGRMSSLRFVVLRGRPKKKILPKVRIV